MSHNARFSPFTLGYSCRSTGMIRNTCASSMVLDVCHTLFADLTALYASSVSSIAPDPPRPHPYFHGICVNTPVSNWDVLNQPTPDFSRYLSSTPHTDRSTRSCIQCTIPLHIPQLNATQSVILLPATSYWSYIISVCSTLVVL
jgi:hypothetical protein